MALKNKTVFGAWIFYMQLQKGLNRSELARLIGVNPKTLYYWERGQSKPVMKTTKKMAKLADGKFTLEMLRPDLFE